MIVIDGGITSGLESSLITWSVITTAPNAKRAFCTWESSAKSKPSRALDVFNFVGLWVFNCSISKLEISFLSSTSLDINSFLFNTATFNFISSYSSTEIA